MISPEKFLQELKKIHDKIPTAYEREVMFILCKAYQEYKYQNRPTALIGINDIFNYLIGKEIIPLTQDEITGKYILPSQDRLLHAITYLKDHGVPIVMVTEMPTLHFQITDKLKDLMEGKRFNEMSIRKHTKELKMLYKSIDLLKGKLTSSDIKF